MSVDNQQKIKDALAKMDVNNDSQWTAEGEPRVDVLRIATGIFNLSREDVTAADPNFSRKNTASAPAAQPSTTAELLGENQAAAVQTATTPVDTPPADPITDTVRAADGEIDAVEELRAQIAEAQSYLQSLEKERDGLLNEIQKVERAIAEMETHLPEEDTDSSLRNQATISGYLQQQQINLQLRAKKIEMFKDVDLSQLPRRAPIDEARLRQKKR